ncbi:acetyl-CoA C-acyltransferase [Tautonia plasticadhaerens]|uniref:acetyl-CoA C-acyltransferase n=1 Tax=Tautonia plasticadhaerens TaxID=2527974 RepID=A0A518H3H8_9BACT|nr:acetyl-CoA C-acyltransferase [Tautonia plasticadhaerens]QDV35377.1 3-ketoacyl-CoA thiolase [Tautonia plasticadhaerens]
MRRAVVIDAVRTPVGRASADRGCYRDVRAEDLSAHVIRALVDRTGIDPRLVEDVRWGCVQQQGEQGFDIARIAALAADLPVEAGGVTVNRNCASGLQAINDAAMSIAAGCEDVQVVGGVEHMGHVPMDRGYDPCPSLFRRHSEAIMHMGLTAEYLAAKYHISRARQDAFALRSHLLSAEATDGGAFLGEVVPTWGRDEAGRKSLLAEDQGIRRDTSPESLAALPPAFHPDGGTVTAGNSSQVSVGAAALLVMSEEKAAELGLEPMARIRSMAVAGVEPEEMGIGPVPAVGKALARAGLALGQVGCIEVNEAFAVQVLAVLQSLGIDERRVNLRGGAIALGHPLGASGARIATTLLHRMRGEGAMFGLATLCVGLGQGVATVFEACTKGADS